MRTKYLFFKTISSLLLLTMISSLQAGGALWKIDSLTPTTVSVASNDTVIVQYRITNRSARTHTLSMDPIQGITQVASGPGLCGHPIELSGMSSCILSLSIAGSVLTGPIYGGPRLCKLGSILQCYQPRQENILQITPAPPITTAPISISNSPLALTGGGVGVITVTNTSNIVAATNVVSNYMGTVLGGNISETSLGCDFIAPGDTCTLTYNAVNASVPLTPFIIKGDNTNEVTAEISIENAIITVSGSPLILGAYGPSDSLTINNTSANITAINVSTNLSSTPLLGLVSEAPNFCDIPPGGSCVFTYTPGTTPIVPTDISIQGDNTNALMAQIAVEDTTIEVVNSPLTLVMNGASDTLTINNLSGFRAEQVAPDLSGTALQGKVTFSPASCDITAGSSCVFTFTPGSSVVAQTNFPIAGLNTNTVTAAMTIAPETYLGLSHSSLGLKISGNARTLTITNTGLVTANSVNYSASPALPAGTSITVAPDCVAIAPGGTCLFTINPGATPSATPGAANPTPVTLSIYGSNTDTVTSAINILAYGSVYQSGYVFAFDDTTPNTGSVGGKVASLVNQSTSIVFDATPVAVGGIHEGSVAGVNSCNGRYDGFCDTGRIIAAEGTNYTAYAAGLCKATIGGYSDWYLPSICELGYSAAPNCGTMASPLIQNMQSNLADNGNIGVLMNNNYYWSSTEYFANQSNGVWVCNFSTKHIFAINKTPTRYTRCIRALTY